MRKYTLVSLTLEKPLTQSGMSDLYINYYKLVWAGVSKYLIKNLYSNSSCALKIGTSQTRSFSYSRGVRQGCILTGAPNESIVQNYINIALLNVL